MGSVIKLGRGLGCRYLGLRPDVAGSLLYTPDGFGVMMQASHEIYRANKDCGRIDGTVLLPGGLYHVRPLQQVNVWNSTALMDVHPTLLDKSSSCLFPHILTAGEGADLRVTIQPRVSIDVAELPWFIKFVFID